MTSSGGAPQGRLTVAGLDPLEIAVAALAAAGEEQAEAVVQVESSGLARFAASEIHQPTLIENATVELRVLHGKPGALRAGTASTNRLDERGIADLVRRARDRGSRGRRD